MRLDRGLTPHIPHSLLPWLYQRPTRQPEPEMHHVYDAVWTGRREELVLEGKKRPNRKGIDLHHHHRSHETTSSIEWEGPNFACCTTYIDQHLPSQGATMNRNAMKRLANFQRVATRPSQVLYIRMPFNMYDGTNRI